MKLHTILCPVDFSEPSHRALACASSLAAWYVAQVTALHVAQPAHVLVGAPPDGGFFADEPAVDLADLRRQVRRDLAPRTDQALVTADVVLGTPTEAIASYARASHPDLIVMGTRGAGGLRHLVLGSVTEAVLRTADCPVLSIPPGAGAHPAFPFRRVLCATDFSATSFGALKTAASLTHDAIADVTVLHVVDETDEHELFVARPYDVHRHGAEREEHAQESLRQIVGRAFFGTRGPALRIAHGAADSEILALAAAMDADLIVMGVSGQSDLQSRLFGSKTNSVIRAAACPVLTARG